MATILKVSKYLRQVHFDSKSDKIVTNDQIKDVLGVDDLSDDATMSLWTFPQFSCLGH